MLLSFFFLKKKANTINTYSYKDTKLNFSNRTQVRPDRVRRQDWIPLLARMERKLEGWKGKLLFTEGRIILIHALLSSAPLCLMSFFVLENWVRERVDRIHSNFVWGNTEDGPHKFYLVLWEQVCMLRLACGLFGTLGFADLNKSRIYRNDNEYICGPNFNLCYIKF